MDILTLSNIGHYTAQIMSIVAIATLLGWLLRIETPGVRYGYWQAIFVLCLLLPFVQGRQVPEIAAAATATVAEQIVVAEPTSAAVSARAFNPWLLALPVLAAGAALRIPARQRRRTAGGTLRDDLRALRRIRTADAVGPATFSGA